MTTIHTDVLVLGSSVGGLTAATYLAHAGLRVVLLEEEALIKRPPLLREPFLLSGLEMGGCVLRVVQELAVPLIEQRRISGHDVAMQVLMPYARIDVRAGRDSLVREMEAYGLAEAEAVLDWIGPIDETGDEIRATLMPGARLNHGPAMVRRLVERSARDATIDPELPAVPHSLKAFIDALIAPLSGMAPGDPQAGSALLIRSTADGGYLMPGAGDPFIDMLRRRFLSLHGEIQTLGEFSVVSSRSEVGIEFARGSLFGRAVVIAAPVELIKEAGAEASPRWLVPTSPPTELPVRLFRTHPEALPVGLGARAVIATEDVSRVHWLARHPDGDNPNVEWLAISGPGADDLDSSAPLGDLNPFPSGDIVEVELGPGPVWDRDASDLRFTESHMEPLVRQRPPVALVGAQVAPSLGFEGEILGARRAALKLIERLGSPKL